METRLLEESIAIREKYSDRIPVLLRTNGNLKMDRKKYLVPLDITLAQFSFILRKRTTLKPKEAIFYLINDIAPVSSNTMSDLYSKYMDPSTQLLVIDVRKENTFGLKV